MGVGAEDHLAAAGQPLPGVLVDDGLVGRDVDSAVFLRRREAEGVVILVDGAAHGAQAIVAVGHGVWNGELLKAGGLGGLDDAHEGDVVGDESVKLQPELLRVGALVVGAEDGIGDGLLPGARRGRVRPGELPVGVHSAPGMIFYHRNYLRFGHCP